MQPSRLEWWARRHLVALACGLSAGLATGFRANPISLVGGFFAASFTAFIISVLVEGASIEYAFEEGLYAAIIAAIAWGLTKILGFVLTGFLALLAAMLLLTLVIAVLRAAMGR